MTRPDPFPDEREVPSELLLAARDGTATAAERRRAARALAQRPDLAALLRPAGVRRWGLAIAAAALVLLLGAAALLAAGDRRVAPGSPGPVGSALARGDAAEADRLLGPGNWRPGGGILRRGAAPELALLAPFGLALAAPDEVRWRGGVGPFELSAEAPDGRRTTWRAEASPAPWPDGLDGASEAGYRVVLRDLADGGTASAVFRVATAEERAAVQRELDALPGDLGREGELFARARVLLGAGAVGDAASALERLAAELPPGAVRALERFLDVRGAPAVLSADRAPR
ncbi:MAG: hypothetical protein AAF682_20480 [Planctomycetota bacterium]